MGGIERADDLAMGSSKTPMSEAAKYRRKRESLIAVCDFDTDGSGFLNFQLEKAAFGPPPSCWVLAANGANDS
jgi:hypothetical protein